MKASIAFSLLALVGCGQIQPVAFSQFQSAETTNAKVAVSGYLYVDELHYTGFHLCQVEYKPGQSLNDCIDVAPARESREEFFSLSGNCVVVSGNYSRAWKDYIGVGSLVSDIGLIDNAKASKC